MSDDFLNNMFNEDFFKNHLNNLNPEDFIDENGEVDFNKLKAESFKIFEKMTGKNPEDLFGINSSGMNNLFPSIDDKKIGINFVQDLNSEEGKKMFDDLVKQNNLSKESKIVKVNGEEHVQETWTNPEGTVNVKRVYRLNENTTSTMLSLEEQIALYEKKEKEAVAVEDYEEAAKFRDVIKTLKNA